MRNDVKSFILASIISADNDKYTEDVKQEIIYRYELQRKTKEELDWKFILEPIGTNNKLLELFLRSGE